MTRKSKPPIAIYSALADATRCRIIDILLAGPIPVHKLADAFAISRPAISRHLRVLKTAGLVAEVKKGRENLYALRPAKLGGAMAWIASITAPPVAAAGEAGAPFEPPAIDKSEEAAPAPILVKAPRTRRKPGGAVDMAGGSEPSPPAVAVTPEKPARAPRPEPAASQMGFDF